MGIFGDVFHGIEHFGSDLVHNVGDVITAPVKVVSNLVQGKDPTAPLLQLGQDALHTIGDTPGGMIANSLIGSLGSTTTGTTTTDRLSAARAAAKAAQASPGVTNPVSYAAITA